jgi:tRNA dimethylallyltransferase
MKSSGERPDAVLIAGPTASGKTALAVKIARKLDGVVINADSMQVYANLSVVTARPSEEEMDGIPHLLFGHVDESEAYSVARWLEDAGAALESVRSQGKVPVFAGGTGLYFKALLEGLSPVPPVDAEVREELRRISRETPDEIYSMLGKEDPKGLSRLKDNDLQRAVRALEVAVSSGRTLAEWQMQGEVAPVADPERTVRLLIEWPVEELRERIARRFEQMVEAGALVEIERLLVRNLDDALPAMRAIGVPQLAGHLRGETDLREAIDRAVIASRQYAKRQRTWFRHQFSLAWERLPGNNPAKTLIKIGLLDDF